jgi:hypothetical protein
LISDTDGLLEARDLDMCGGEALYVPRAEPRSEDDGHPLDLLMTGDRTDLIVMDAITMTEQAVSTSATRLLPRDPHLPRGLALTDERRLSCRSTGICPASVEHHLADRDPPDSPHAARPWSCRRHCFGSRSALARLDLRLEAPFVMAD